MIGQTTDSGSANFPMAREMEKAFEDSEYQVKWDSSENHVRCFAHKLGLVVKHGLGSLHLSAGHIKPTTPPNTSVPVPSLILNDNVDGIALQSKTDEEDEDDIPDHSGRLKSNEDLDSDEEGYSDYEDPPNTGCTVCSGYLKVFLHIYFQYPSL